MFGENKIEDSIRFAKAFITNQIARFSPSYYVRLTEQTGRGGGVEQPDDVAEYFLKCFYEYFHILGIEKSAISEYLNDKTLLEYGPGDTAGVALLMYAHGARKVYCVDRFPLANFSDFSLSVFSSLFSKLEGDVRHRAEACFNEQGTPSSGFDTRAIEYLVKSNGLSGLKNEVDIVFSRAVLEHVNDLSATFEDMYEALVNNGVSIHQVDLKSHGLHKRNSLDFLTWPDTLWHLMYSHKGVPNRYRVNAYKELIDKSGFQLRLLAHTLLAQDSELTEVRPYLIDRFKGLSDEDLSWLGFWMVLERN